MTFLNHFLNNRKQSAHRTAALKIFQQRRRRKWSRYTLDFLIYLTSLCSDPISTSEVENHKRTPLPVHHSKKLVCLERKKHKKMRQLLFFASAS